MMPKRPNAKIYVSFVGHPSGIMLRGNAQTININGLHAKQKIVILLLKAELISHHHNIGS